MFSTFKHCLKKQAGINDAQFEILKPHLRPVKVKKKETLLQQGDICKYIYFVHTGTIRTHIHMKGKERTIEIIAEDGIISDWQSFHHGCQAELTIEAIEDSQLIAVGKEFADKITQIHGGDNAWLLSLVSEKCIIFSKRLAAMMAKSTDEQYLEYARTNPDLVSRIDDQYIASLLGVTPECFSRMMKRLKRKKLI